MKVPSRKVSAQFLLEGGQTLFMTYGSLIGATMSTETLGTVARPIELGDTDPGEVCLDDGFSGKDMQQLVQAILYSSLCIGWYLFVEFVT